VALRETWKWSPARVTLPATKRFADVSVHLLGRWTAQIGASGRTRTDDFLFTKEGLLLLRHGGFQYAKCSMKNAERGFRRECDSALSIPPFCIWNGAPGWDLASGLILRTDALYTLSYGSRETGAGTGIRIRTKTLATSRAAAYTTPAGNWRPRLDSHQQPAP